MKKRFEGVKALAFISIMTGINTIFMVSGMVLPFSSIVMLLVMPLITTMVCLYVDYKYTLIYALACSLIAFIDPLNAMFMVIPSIITGIAFGVLIRKYIHGYFTIFIVSIVLISLQLIAQQLISIFFEKNVEQVMCTILGFSESAFHYIYLLILFLISLAQATLTYIIATNELTKINYEFNEKKNCFIPVIIITSLLAVLTISFYFISIPISYLLLGFTFYFGVILAYYNFSFYQRKIILFIQLPLYFISIICFLVSYSYFDTLQRIYFTLPTIFSEIVVAISIVIYQKCLKKGQINETLFDKTM